MKPTIRPLCLSIAVFATLTACEPTPSSTTTAPATVVEVDPAQLQTRLAMLSQQVETAEALRSVKRLQWAYGHYSELGLWYDFADLFADSGIGHYVQGDLNRDQIRTLFYEQVGQGRLGLAQGRIYPHISFSPVLTLENDGAVRGRFRILAMLGGYGGNATWFHGVYENVYIREQGIWQLNEISNTAQVTGSFKNGLAAQSKAPLDVPTFAFHYAPAQVGTLNKVLPVASGATATLPNAATNAATPAAEPAQPSATLQAMQQRLTRLQDEAAIVNLQHQYAYYLDQHDWDKLVALFAEQATFESGQQGVYIGKASIRNGLNQFGAVGLAAGNIDEHLLLQTYVSVAADGQSAKARVDQLGMQGVRGQSAQWTQGLYENTFVKENGEWRIQAIHYYPRLITDYSKGWGDDAQAAPSPSIPYPPDAPASETYAIYPTFYIPAFHFAHPVTGRAPQYPEGDPASLKSDGLMATVVQNLAPQPNSSAPMSEQLRAAETQAQRALAVDTVENLVNAYAYYLDECLVQDAASLFASDGLNDIAGIGQYQGPARIAEALTQAYCPAGRQAGALTLHHALQPVVSVSDDGQHATITARLWQVSVTGSANDYYLLGRWQGEATQQNGQWQLRSLGTDYTWVAALNEGWANATRNAELSYAPPESMRASLAPDRPSTRARLAPWPE